MLFSDIAIMKILHLQWVKAKTIYLPLYSISLRTLLLLHTNTLYCVARLKLLFCFANHDKSEILHKIGLVSWFVGNVVHEESSIILLSNCVHFMICCAVVLKPNDVKTWTVNSRGSESHSTFTGGKNCLLWNLQYFLPVLAYRPAFFA